MAMFLRQLSVAALLLTGSVNTGDLRLDLRHNDHFLIVLILIEAFGSWTIGLERSPLDTEDLELTLAKLLQQGCIRHGVHGVGNTILKGNGPLLFLGHAPLVLNLRGVSLYIVTVNANFAVQFVEKLLQNTLSVTEFPKH